MKYFVSDIIKDKTEKYSDSVKTENYLTYITMRFLAENKHVGADDLKDFIDEDEDSN